MTVRLIIINDVQIEKALAQLSKDIRRRRTLMSRIGKNVRDDVRNRIRTQNQGTWAKPGKWIKAKKDARKALSGTAKFVRSKSTKDRAEIFGAMPGTWTLTQHDRGFTRTPSGRRVTLNLKRPGALNLPSSRKMISFIDRKVTSTPARKIWSEDFKVKLIVEKEGRKWLREVARKAMAKAGIRGVV